MSPVDILSKIAPIVAAVITVCGVIFGAIFAARGIGLRYKQEHAIDIAIKRLAFWDSYLKTGMATASADETQRRLYIQEEVFAGIQEVRDDVNAQLAELSWRVMVQQARLPALPSDRSSRISLIIFMGLAILMLGLASFSLIMIFAFSLHDNKSPSLFSHGGFITIVLLTCSVFLIDQAQRIKYKRPKRIISKV